MKHMLHFKSDHILKVCNVHSMNVVESLSQKSHAASTFKVFDMNDHSVDLFEIFFPSTIPWVSRAGQVCYFSHGVNIKYGPDDQLAAEDFSGGLFFFIESSSHCFLAQFGIRLNNIANL